MEKFQVQFLVGAFVVNHIVEDESIENVKQKFFVKWKTLRSREQAWEIEDSLLDPEAITFLRVRKFEEAENVSEKEEATSA